MRGLVGAGLGVALLPALASHVRDEHAPAPICRPLVGRPAYRTICLVRHAVRALSPAAAAFAEILTAAYTWDERAS
jgi:DNA-binding transcriptional LysR family regulator